MNFQTFDFAKMLRVEIGHALVDLHIISVLIFEICGTTTTTFYKVTL